MFEISYQYFMAVAKTQNFHKAAEACFVSQPAISMQVRQLETKLGYSLLDRTSKKVQLTPEGALLFQTLLSCESEMKKCMDNIRSSHDSPRLVGQLRLGIHSGWSIDLFRLPYVAEFQRSYPDIDVVIESFSFTELTERLETRELDIIISNQEAIRQKQNIVSMSLLGSYEYVYIISKTHPYVQRQLLPEYFSHIPFYTHSSTIYTKEEKRQSITSANPSIDPDNIVFVPNMDSVISAVENNKGFSGVLECSRFVTLPTLKVFPSTNSCSILASYLQDNNKNELVSAFITTLTQMNEKNLLYYRIKDMTN